MQQSWNIFVRLNPIAYDYVGCIPIGYAIPLRATNGFISIWHNSRPNFEVFVDQNHLWNNCNEYVLKSMIKVHRRRMFLSIWIKKMSNLSFILVYLTKFLNKILRYDQIQFLVTFDIHMTDMNCRFWFRWWLFEVDDFSTSTALLNLLEKISFASIRFRYQQKQHCFSVNAYS